LLIKENIQQLAKSTGLNLSFRLDAPEIWDTAAQNAAYLPVAYTSSSIDFQWAYQRGHGGNWNDISMIVHGNGKPVAIWPLSLSEKGGAFSLSAHGLPVAPPLFADACPKTSRKRITKACLDIADAIARENGISSWKSAESFLDSHEFGSWHIESMSRGAKCSVKHEMFIDLHQSMAEIKQGFRKSYKSLITSGARDWSVLVLDTSDGGIWQKFRELHFQASGRQTRSDETWEIQLAGLGQGQGFLVYLLNAAGEMNGGGLFNFTRDEGLYAVAAYNRALSDQPLGHLVQYRAIEELKRRGQRWYKIGERSYATDNPVPTVKEISIGDFKQGFASHMFPRFELEHPVEPAPHSPQLAMGSLD
jgi:FemAB family protein